MNPLDAEAEPIGVKGAPAGVALGSLSTYQLKPRVLVFVNTHVEASEQSSYQIFIWLRPIKGKKNNAISNFFICGDFKISIKNK
jgi:hypothetical protein